MQSYADILRLLSQHQVQFILIGGVAAIIQGAPIMTFDLDLVHERSPQNIAALLLVLRQLDACYRGRSQRLEPQESHLASPGHQLLQTRFGPLDLLGTVEQNRSYEDLLPHTTILRVWDLEIKVLELSELIAIKARIARPKDLAVLDILRHTLAERG